MSLNIDLSSCYNADMNLYKLENKNYIIETDND